jgi:hypothetical protein
MLTTTQAPAGPSPAPKAVPVQAKLRVGATDDPLEREADATADEVMRMPDPGLAVLQRCPGGCPGDDELGTNSTLQRCAVGHSNDEVAWRHALPMADRERPQAKPSDELSGGADTPGVSAVTERAVDRNRGAGTPLPASVRNFFEPRFGRSFENVRLHTDADADRVARSISARAFTSGADIVFADGEYRPGTATGRRLLAHELMHTVQQSSAGAPHGVQRSAVPQRPANPLRIPEAESRAGAYWAPDIDPSFSEGKGTGSYSHKLALRTLTSLNHDLFGEAPVRGTTAEELKEGALGKADILRATGLVGVEFDSEGQPVFPGTSADTLYHGAPLTEEDNKKTARPAANRESSSCVGCPGFKRGDYKICRLDAGTLEVGELKPANSANEWLGIEQVTRYRDQLDYNLYNIKLWVDTPLNKEKVDPPNSTVHHSVSLLTDRTVVPAALEKESSSPMLYDPIREYGTPTPGLPTKGRMTIHYSGHDGIFLYRWHPIYPDDKDKPSDVSSGIRSPEAEAASEAQTEASPQSQALPEPPTFSPESWNTSARITEMFVYVVNAPRENGEIVLREWQIQVLRHLSDYVEGFSHAVRLAFGIGGSLTTEELNNIRSALRTLDELTLDFRSRGASETVNEIFDLMQELIIYIHQSVGWETHEDLYRGRCYIGVGLVVLVFAGVLAAAVTAESAVVGAGVVATEKATETVAVGQATATVGKTIIRAATVVSN